MTAYDGEGMCPKIKLRDGDGILLLSSVNISQARTMDYEGFDHNYCLFVLHHWKKLSCLHLMFELLRLFVQLIGLS